MALDIEKLTSTAPPMGMEFHVSTIGPRVAQVNDLERSTAFYTKVFGFMVADVYPETTTPGFMAFLRCNTDHHCLALVGTGDGKINNRALHQFAFEVSSLDEAIAHPVPGQDTQLPR